MSVDPATATLLLTIAGTGASVLGQAQTAKAQKAANKQQFQSEMQAYRDNIDASNRQVQQEAEAATEKANRAALEGRKAMSSATVAAGEAGVTGMSVDALMRDLQGQALENVGNIEANYLRRKEGVEMDRINMRNRTVSQINAMQTPMTPNLIGAGLEIGKAVNTYRNERQPTKGS